ncbi:MAG TPA: SDR family NAD(P)-dependent oxidoreductase [Novosphingobium sp.]|nr:SDR family NAD(P)-dependent oxidoreductase [Novosphingobium sp.]
MASEFEGACTVVTGGGSGIGLSLAKALAARGARVAIADIDGARALAAAEEIGHGARGYLCDVSDRQSLAALAADVEAHLGGASFVFANAGVCIHGSPLHETDPAEFDWLFDVNVRGTFNTIHAFAPQVLAQAAGGRPARFVLTGSENSVGLPFQGVMTAYTATKHAIMALADGLRRDLEGSGVGVSIVCPGPVNTGLWDSRRSRPDRFGGNAPLAGEEAHASAGFFANFVHPDETARLCLEGMANDEFIIITEPYIRGFAEKRHAEVQAALALADERVGSRT